jgi:hypothetical protein
VPEPTKGDLAGHGDGSRLGQLLDAGAYEGDPEQVAVIRIDHHAGPAGVAVGVQAGSGHGLAGVDVDHPGAVPSASGLVGGQADRPGRRVAEEHLGHRVEVGGDRVGAHSEVSRGCPAARAAIAAPAMRA